MHCFSRWSPVNSEAAGREAKGRLKAYEAAGLQRSNALLPRGFYY